MPSSVIVDLCHMFWNNLLPYKNALIQPVYQYRLLAGLQLLIPCLDAAEYGQILSLQLAYVQA